MFTKMGKAARALRLAAGLSLATFVALPACSSDESTPAPKKSEVTLRFNITPTVRKDPKLPTNLSGTVRGSIYLAEDVSLAGPRQGAEAVAPVVLNVDLAADKPSDESVKIPGLTENQYAFLGFLDLNGNGAESSRPDAGDLVTVPTSETKFEVVGGVDSEAVVSFNLLYGG
jgi:hypothetical protein